MSVRIGIASLLTPLAMAAVLCPACSGDRAANATRPDPEAEAGRTVRVVRAGMGSLPRVVVVTGTLAAEEQVVLGFKVSGRLSQIPVDLGSRVTKGQALARLVPIDAELRVQQSEAAFQQALARLGLDAADADDRVDPEATPLVRQARAVLDEARSARERVEALHGQQLVSRAELDAAEAAYQVADSRYQDALDEVRNRQALLAQRRFEVEMARQQLEDSTLTSPFHGAVRERHATSGEYVTAGQPVLTVVRVHPLRLRLAVPERDAAGVRTGQEVRLTIEGDATVHSGKVARLSPAIDERSRTLMLEAEIPNPDGSLRPGAFATAEVVTAAGEPAVFVPATAVVTFAGIEKVIVVENGRTVEKRVRTGRRHEDQVEITEGIAAGERVVVEPGSLAGGETVTAVE